MSQMEDLFRSVGGVPVAQGGSPDPIWNFGWLAPQWRTDEQEREHHEYVSSLRPFHLSGKVDDDVKRTSICKLWAHERVAAAIGRAYTGTHQLTGSCVGAGAGNMVNSLNFIETIMLGQPEKIFLCFYPYHYGRGRLASGMSRRGEGSTGSGQAKAIKEDGVLDNAVAGVPQPQSFDDGIIWGKSVEMAWSDGDGPECMKYLDVGRKHPITEVVRCRNHDDVRQALIAGKTVTAASMLGFEASVVGEGADACLLARRRGQWSHQMSILDYWEHPRHGPLFWDMNQWGLDAHGTCPSGQPRGGAWITADMVDYQCNDEVFAFFGLNGDAVPEIDWSAI